MSESNHSDKELSILSSQCNNFSTPPRCKISTNGPYSQPLPFKVWAADDYEIFKRMMITKNIELQLQALELLQHRFDQSHTLRAKSTN